jgi:hypothetical protein
MKQDLSPSVDQVSVVDVALLLMMMVKCGEEEGLCGLCCPSNSRHSMSATCGPRDIISLVTPRLGGFSLHFYVTTTSMCFQSYRCTINNIARMYVVFFQIMLMLMLLLFFYL